MFGRCGQTASGIVVLAVHRLLIIWLVQSVAKWQSIRSILFCCKDKQKLNNAPNLTTQHTLILLGYLAFYYKNTIFRLIFNKSF
jgi:hypothetical protein